MIAASIDPFHSQEPIMIRTVLAAGLVLAVAAPAAAQSAKPLPANCVKHQVHTPAGKMVHNAPVTFCKADRADAVARADQAPRTPTTPAVARD